MQVWPLVKFYLRNEAEIDSLLNSGTSNPVVIAAIGGLLEILFPAKKALIADALSTLKEATAPVPAPLKNADGDYVSNQ